MRKVTLAVAALTLLVAGFVLAQVASPDAGKPRDLTLFAVPKSQNGTVTPVGNVQLSQNLRLRVEGQHDGRVIGTLMTNVNGQWVEVILASKNMRAATAPAVNR
ncbi:MAG TPA: hypothetical protein VGF28_22400 [Thermoanaerobaculia bacterium]